MSDDLAQLKIKLEDALFNDSSRRPYAVLDGARHTPTYNYLVESGAHHACLFGGDLDPEVIVTAPHLVELREEDTVFDWIFEGWGDSRGIFLLSAAPLRDLRKHLRSLNYAEMPDGEMVIFRFYDPRALRSFMPIATPDQQDGIFGGLIDRILVENEDGTDLIDFEPRFSMA